MNAQEVAQLLGYASTLDTKISADSVMQVRAWTGLLADVPAPIAKAAVDAHYTQSTDTIMPADILGYWRDHKREQAERRHNAEVKALTAAPATAPEITLAERFAIEQAHRKGTDPDIAAAEATAHRLVLTVPCPYCKARPHQRCTGYGGRPLKALAHPSRLDALHQATA